jgi:tetratricopeptide (TPR) repeat protein
MLVQRHDLANELVESIRHSILQPSEQQHHLLIGMRGIGKTHLVSLMYHRVGKMEDLREKVLIAWLREEEWGVTSFLDLLLRILRSLQKEYPAQYNAQLCDRVESLYGESPDTAQQIAAELLKDFVGDRTLLLLTENLDDLFEGLGDSGQQQFRDYLEKYHFCTIFATSQHSFKGIDNKKAPFYNFFNLQYLEKLTLDEVVGLLKNIAKLEGNKELESLIQTPKGRSRIEVIHHLAGGNHRVYMIFAEFLTRDSLDRLVKPFLQTLDELTPYYQARMAWLSPQQRKIVEFLCDRRGAVMVKEIAQRCFMTHQTASSQLKQLLGMGYVTSESIGRESYYELREVLMRFCMDVKKHRGEPISLIVDFLRFWYTKEELKQRLERLGVGFSAIGKELVDNRWEKSHLKYQLELEKIPHNAIVEREYLLRALGPREVDNYEDPRVAAYVREIENCKEKKDYISALNLANKLVAIRGQAGDWLEKARCLHHLERYDEGLECYDRAIELDANDQLARALRGYLLNNLKRYDEALASFDRAIELDGNHKLAWAYRGDVLKNLKRYDEALASFDRAIELDENYQYSWFLQGNVLDTLKRYEEALESYDMALKIDESNQYIWLLRGNLLQNLKRYDEALESLDRALELDENYQYAWVLRGYVLYNLKSYEEALISYDMALELDENYHLAWANRGYVLYNIKRYEEALASYDRALELDVNYQSAWADRGYVLNKLKRYDEALASYDRALERDANDAGAWAHRGNVLYNIQRYNEALTSYDRAIELEYDDRLVWFIRGYLLKSLKRYDQALASLDRAIELEYDDLFVWTLRGYLLNSLKRYDEALASLDKAIELGNQSSSVFLNCAIAILGLNHWDEGIAALDEALQCIELDDEASSEDAELIISTLFASNYAVISQTRIASIIAVYEKHKYLSVLGQGIVRNIPALMSEMVSDKAARTWLELWQEQTSNYEQFQIPIRLLNAAVRYKETKGDRRVLLELPIEERTLLEPLVSGKVE